MHVVWMFYGVLHLCCGYAACVCVCVPADTVEMITPESLSDQPVRTPHVIGLYNTTMQCSHGKLAITHYNRLNKMCELSVLLIVQLLIQYIVQGWTSIVLELPGPHQFVTCGLTVYTRSL